jgi:hypothetical protein
MDEGALGMKRLSLKRLSGKGLERGGAPLLGTLKDMLRLRIQASLSNGAPLRLKGIWNGAHILGTLKDEWGALGRGHLSPRDSMTGTWREGSVTGVPERC